MDRISYLFVGYLALHRCGATDIPNLSRCTANKK